MSRGAFESNESQALLGHFHSNILKLETRNVQRSEILERQCAFMQVSILRSPVDVYYLQERCTATLHCMVVARESDRLDEARAVLMNLNELGRG